mmetsp:Transcript_76274/g.213935  ORF Transcript_76274/g.213935 Transcript_76274/m.213935 type:complete len:205 (-) Transcript_76274:4-618(-)
MLRGGDVGLSLLASLLHHRGHPPWEAIAAARGRPPVGVRVQEDVNAVAAEDLDGLRQTVQPRGVDRLGVLRHHGLEHGPEPHARHLGPRLSIGPGRGGVGRRGELGGDLRGVPLDDLRGGEVWRRLPHIVPAEEHHALVAELKPAVLHEHPPRVGRALAAAGSRLRPAPVLAHGARVRVLQQCGAVGLRSGAHLARLASLRRGG